MSAPPTTVSSSVKRFMARGHVVRERNPADGRSFVLRLTPEGRAADQAAGIEFLPVLDRVVTALGSREPSVRRALEALRSALDGATGQTTSSGGSGDTVRSRLSDANDGVEEGIEVVARCVGHDHDGEVEVGVDAHGVVHPQSAAEVLHVAG